MNRIVKFFLTLLFFTLANVSPALAFQLIPMSQVLAPVGNSSTKSYEVANNSDERVAVEVSIVKRHMDIDGQESYEPAEEDFLIYPSQMILEPQSVQTVRVTWLGDPSPSQELAYRLVAEQLPISLFSPEEDTARPSGSVQVLLRYLGSLYIRPDTTTVDVQIASVEAIESERESQLAITVINHGTAYARLQDVQIGLTAQGVTLPLNAEQLQAINDQVVLAGSQRRFIIPRPSNLPSGPVTATLQYRHDR